MYVGLKLLAAGAMDNVRRENICLHKNDFE